MEDGRGIVIKNCSGGSGIVTNGKDKKEHAYLLRIYFLFCFLSQKEKKAYPEKPGSKKLLFGIRRCALKQKNGILNVARSKRRWRGEEVGKKS